MITLVVDSGTRPIAFPLSEALGEIVAGALPENAIYLPFRGISRRHFSVFKKKMHGGSAIWAARTAL